MADQPEPNSKPRFDFSHRLWRHGASLAGLLALLWLLLSGFYTPLILSLGALSIAFTVYLALRMDVIDYEGLPFHIAWRTMLFYWPWLIVEIVKANIDVTKRVLSPELDISPTLFDAKTSEVSDLGQVIYANSITLTPGTVSVDLGPGLIQVHALSRDAADGILEGEMDRRCHNLERIGAD